MNNFNRKSISRAYNHMISQSQSKINL